MEGKELTLREIQLGSLEVLKKIKEICEKENIKYFLGYGTLLGAVRHQGFIPWDDDIDIMMPREDYEKFIKYCIKNEKKLGYFSLKHYRTCKEYIYPIARFCDTRYRVEYKNTKEYGLGLFVDIYPIDGINLKNKNYLRTLRIQQFLILLAGNKKYIKSSSIIKTILKYPLFYISQYLNLNDLLKKIDKKSQKYKFMNSEYAECVVWGMKYYKIPKESYLKLKKEKFEDEFFPIPEKYDIFLKEYYGDYMKLPPLEKQIPHHFYKVYKTRY